jgi:hypothetical protein
LNSRPPVPQTGALTKLRHAPKNLWATRATIRYRLGRLRLWTNTGLAPHASYNGLRELIPIALSCRSTSDSQSCRELYAHIRFPAFWVTCSGAASTLRENTSNLVRVGGFEPPTTRIRGEDSTMLSYTLIKKLGRGGEIRTPSALKLSLPKRVGSQLPIYAPMGNTRGRGIAFSLVYWEIHNKKAPTPRARGVLNT